MINAETGWLQPVSAASSATPTPPGPPPSQASHLPPGCVLLPGVGMYTEIDARAFQGVSGEELWLLPKSYGSGL